jgi:hypothetical protein
MTASIVTGQSCWLSAVLEERKRAAGDHRHVCAVEYIAKFHEPGIPVFDTLLPK